MRNVYLLFFLMLISSAAFSQARVLTGFVRDSATNSPVTAATIRVAGTKSVTTSGSDGAFTINLPATSAQLEVSYVGYANQNVTVNPDQTTIIILLGNSSASLNEVVVTALGISRQAKSLTYSVQKVSNEELTQVRDANVVNSLQGKVAGVTISRSSSGIGGSTRVIIRGNKSTRENQPLYVVDGVPLVNFSPAQPGGEYGQSVGYAGIDGGDGISNINPEDIESMSILKGASAAALYGSSAANGVILITTKKGKAGITRVNASSELFFDSRMYKQPLQFKYGQTTPGTTSTPFGSSTSWSDSVVNAPDYTNDFFQTGVTSFNSVSLSGGTDKSQSYFSYSYADNKGIIPTSQLKRHNLNFHQTSKFFNDKLTADFNVLYVHQNAHNRPTSGLYLNPLAGLYELPRGIDFNQYKNSYEVSSSVRNTYVQNWWDVNVDAGKNANELEQNPYWILNRNPNDNALDRVYTNFSLNYKITSWLNIQARGNVDKTFNNIEAKSYATTSPILTAANGSYTLLRSVFTQYYGDVLLSANKNLSKNLGLSATIGSSINDGRTEQTTFGTRNSGDGLRFANVFTLNNILPASLTVSPNTAHRQLQAVFATAQLSVNNYAYLDLTARNDWSSTLAFTPNEKKGFFYYSAGLTGVLSDMFKMSEPISFSKVRVSYSKVGNDVNIYATNPASYNIDNQNGSTVNQTGSKPGTYLKPEDNRSFEAGTEWRFLKNRIGFDFTYYINNNRRQYIVIPVTPGSPGNLTSWTLNTGNIRNNGVELSVNITPVQTKHFSWFTTVNYALNKNKVLQIADPSLGVTQSYFPINTIDLLNAAYIKEGGSWGDIYGRFFARAADNSIIVDSAGTPQKGYDSSTAVGNGNVKYLGNPNPKYTIGWNNTFTIQNFTVSFLIDGRFGGKVMSVTQAVLDQLGDSKATADARDAGGVNISATKQDGSKFSGPLDPFTFYNAVGGRSGISEYYVYDATNIRLREASISYRIPVKTKWITSCQFSVIGRNLFFFKKEAPFDPELSMGTGNALQGVETFGIPTTRSIGASLKIGF